MVLGCSRLACMFSWQPPYGARTHNTYCTVSSHTRGHCIHYHRTCAHYPRSNHAAGVPYVAFPFLCASDNCTLYTHRVQSFFWGSTSPPRSEKMYKKCGRQERRTFCRKKQKNHPPPFFDEDPSFSLTADFRTKGDDFKGTSRTCVRAASSSPLLTTTFSNAVPFLPHTHKKQRAISTSPFPPFPPSYPTRRVFCVGGFREPHTHTL